MSDPREEAAVRRRAVNDELDQVVHSVLIARKPDELRLEDVREAVPMRYRSKVAKLESSLGRLVRDGKASRRVRPEPGKQSTRAVYSAGGD